MESDFPRPADEQPRKKKKMVNKFAKKVKVPGGSPAAEKVGALDYIVSSTPERSEAARQKFNKAGAKKKVKGGKRIL